MSLEANTGNPTLFPCQVCFVVDNVPEAACDCAARFGWGPFQQFTARVPEGHYRGWSGRKVTDVALGMAGAVQVELIHVHEGHDAVESYQAEYGTGFQHLGIRCHSREAALSHLEACGGILNELVEYAGIRIAFVDVPTGPAMFELLQPSAEADPTGGPDRATPGKAGAEVFALDRATIVTGNMDEALGFYAAAFGWSDAKAEPRTLRYGNATTRAKRFVGRAGSLQLELLEPQRGGDDPYSAHLARRRHGLVHAGGPAVGEPPPGPAIECEWIEAGEAFALYDWAGGMRGLQVRRPAA